ncbi:MULTISPECIES: DUF3019 domain-containing protein [unclassified Shewanella]|uniref:DUF3019 domain-containing protein n=1 Tax=unclassified Shewanella TaxID=196818 RepID=UPI001BC4DC94|nr:MULTISPECIES: DUF3019 domain-containing protein [unclassified Shewanella]GIU05259.1 hypothetical protein TUM4444_01320 [Shewanella sp. MBTL60-112-B1]GIU24206.1 hypothetical protein TUM4445_01050 [Shewanella sp. MBTL60-112-B2]
MTKLYQWLGLLLFISPSSVLAKQPTINFTATPEQCVALHKGQTCYQDVLFQWQTPAAGRYCLIESKNRQQLTCWDGQSVQQYQYSFEGDATTAFSLIRHDNLQLLAEVKVIVTWVYKAPKQSPSGWRLF